MKEIFSCYKSEGTKLIEILNQKKNEGYVVRDLEFDGGLLSATFESYDKDFVYSIDYSNLYNNSISNENEYFDIARLNGWKLQFITEGMGIWINEDVENAVPFLLEEEYLRMEKEDYQKRMRSIKRTAIFNTSLLILGLFHFIWRGGLNVFYGMPFLVIYYYLIYGIIHSKDKYPELVIVFVSECYVSSMYLVSKIEFIYAMIIEIICIFACFLILKNNSLILKKVLFRLFLIFWIILFVLQLVFGG
ncbi:hypothetical protein [Thomasclavelia cocleata]|uniref:hypothetical protein n=1 Tax=Thomasclavelia cocleata TaxID=69824 RepID=UPI00258EF21F|nr:hypothetical protein [Thomasclavelia cocleata]